MLMNSFYKIMTQEYSVTSYEGIKSDLDSLDISIRDMAASLKEFKTYSLLFKEYRDGLLAPRRRL